MIEGDVMSEIRLKQISKYYKIYKNQADRLKEALSIKNKKYYEKFYALKNIDLEIQQGEVVGIIGKNGSGKSTLLKLICQILKPSSGLINIKGNIGAILELSAGINPELNGYENIDYFLAIHSNIDKNIKQEIIDFADIGNFIYEPVKTYSSGMQARLSFALAIHINPDILIVDEALSVGDVAFQKKCFSKIEFFCKKQDKIVIFVTHSPSSIIQLCSRAVLIHNGELIIDGKPKEVIGLYNKHISSVFDRTQKIDKMKIRGEYNGLLSKRTNTSAEVQDAINDSFYNTEFLSKSKIVYNVNGAKISNVKILNMAGEKVNILTYKREYFFEYDVEFYDSYDDIEFAMFIKSNTGIMLSGRGESFVENAPISVIKNEKRNIRWKFRADFNQEYYFLNCAVNSFENGEKKVLHRIVDAYMFKVQKYKKNASYGLVDLNIEFLA